MLLDRLLFRISKIVGPTVSKTSFNSLAGTTSMGEEVGLVCKTISLL